MNILIFILIIIVLIYLLIKSKSENFTDLNPNLVGYEEGMPLEYQTLNSNMQMMRNIKEFSANNWHLRFPYMVNQRYSYDDSNKQHRIPTIRNYALLGDLSLNMDIRINNNEYRKQKNRFVGYDHNDSNDYV